MSKHTPTPWQIADEAWAPPVPGTPNRRVICDANSCAPIAVMLTRDAEEYGNESVGYIPGRAQGNAEYIIRSVNSHEALLEAAKAALSIIDKTQGSDRVGILLSKAIAQAEGKRT